MLKVGVIDFINVYPLTYQLVNQNSQFHFFLDTPANLSSLLKNNELDIAQISSSFYLQNKDEFELIKEFGVAATRSVKSVHLYHNIPIETIQTIYVTPQSKASVNLLRVLAMHHWFIDCDFVVVNDFEELIHKPAFLLIGDMALIRPHFEGYETTDLASSWYEMTNLPFVFGVTCVRKDVFHKHPEEIKAFIEAMRTSYAWGKEHRDEVIKAARKVCPLPKPYLNNYYDTLEFELTDHHFQGMHQFEKYLQMSQKQMQTT